MFKNKKFGFYALVLCLTGLAYTFICAGLESGQAQIIRTVITPEGGGWTAADIQLPMTVGSFLAVPGTFLCCALFIRAGIRQTLIPCAALASMGCVGLVCANGLDVYGGAAAGNYPLFFLSLAAMRCACAMFQAAVTVLCLQWFIRFRGRVLGAVTLGVPLFSAVGAAPLGSFILSHLGGDYRPVYVSVAAALALLALAVRFLLRDRPEEAGLYPDGDGRPPAGEAESPPPLGLGQLLRDRRTWLVLLAGGAYVAAASGFLTFLEPRLLARHGGGPGLLNQAAPWLALGTILGIPASYLFGLLWDRLGALRTAMLLGLAELLAVFLLWYFPKEVGLLTGLALCLALACLMGGVSTAVPAMLGHVFGRQQVLSACRVVLPGLLLIRALTGPVGTMLGGGQRARLFPVLFVLTLAGFLASVLLLGGKGEKKPPENEK